MPFGGRHNKDHKRWRLFQDLKQSVKGRRREHVDFVDNKYFVSASGGRVLRTLPQLTDVVDTGIRGGINFKNVYRLAQCDFLT